MMGGKRTALLALVAAAVSAAAPDTPAAITLDQLMAALHGVRHVEARYIEHRYLHALRSPLETRGSLRFDAPDRLEKATDASAGGAADRMMVDGNRLTIDRGDGATPIVLMLNEHPEIGVLIGSVRSTLSGDTDALRRVFEISLSGTLEEWQMMLRPRDAGQQRLMQWMRISGQGARITAMDSQDPDGDHSDMSIVELRR